MKFANVYSDVGRFIEHVRFTCQCSPYGVRGKHKPRLIFGNRSVYPHFAEGRVNLLLPNIALYGIHQS